VAERIRSFCEASGIPLSSGSVTVTVSIGVASVGPGCKRADDLVAAADAALYEAKRAGRNQVKARQT
jgi:diguanylate cyclase (GGDEF)-like protein